ncbi:hypothetical protein ACORG1_34615 (plasmid) [Mycobacterium sp. TJFP1]
MLNDRSAKQQSQRLADLGIDLSAQRLKEVHAGAPLHPQECEVNPAVAETIGQSDDEVLARVHRQMLTQFIFATVVPTLVVVGAVIGLLIVIVIAE